MITWDHVAELLALAAVYDQRKADELDVKAWLQVATHQRWTPGAVQRVIVEHYSCGADRPRITPAAISDRLRTLRGRAAETFAAPRIPDGLPNHDYPAWLRRQLAAHVDHVLDDWAETGTEPGRVLPAERPVITQSAGLATAAPTQHRAAIASGVRTMNARTMPGAR